MGASRRDLPAGCARRSPERSPKDRGSIPLTSTKVHARSDRRIPLPSGVQRLRRARRRISGYPSLVRKILVSVDDKLLTRIDRAARAAGLSRSAYLARLAECDLGTDRGPGAGRQARRAIARLEKLFRAQPIAGDATAAVRAERDSR